MKKAKKALLLVLCAALLVSASVMGTVAYLTAEDSVENTFTVGKVQIKLDEAKVNKDGTYATNHENRVEKNEYHLLPGQTYIKDPTVTLLQGSEKSYVRMLVKVANINNLMTVFNDPAYYDNSDPETGVFLLQKFVGGWDDKLWVFDNNSFEGTTGVYEFRYFAPVDALSADLTLDDLFETITIPGEDVTSDNIELLKDVKIDVIAQAIQAAGFADANAAWNAFNP